MTPACLRSEAFWSSSWSSPGGRDLGVPNSKVCTFHSLPVVQDGSAVTLWETMKGQRPSFVRMLLQDSLLADKRQPKCAPSCLLGRTLGPSSASPGAVEGQVVLTAASWKAGDSEACNETAAFEGALSAPDTARAVGLWIKLSLAKLPSKHSCRNVALFLPLPLASWCSSYMVQRGFILFRFRLQIWLMLKGTLEDIWCFWGSRSSRLLLVSAHSWG